MHIELSCESVQSVDLTSMSRVNVALYYIMVVQMRCLCIVKYSCMELCDWWLIVTKVKYEYVKLWYMFDMWMTCDVWIYCDYFVHRLSFERIITPFPCYYARASLEYRQSDTSLGTWCWVWCYASLVACRSSLIVRVTLTTYTRGNSVLLFWLCCISFTLILMLNHFSN